MPKTKKKSKRAKRKSAPRISIADLLALRRGPIQQGGLGSYPTTYWNTQQPIPIIPQGQDLQQQINSLNSQLISKLNSQEDEYKRSVNLMNRQMIELALLEEEEKKVLIEEKEQSELEGRAYDIDDAIKEAIKPGRKKGPMSEEAKAAMKLKRAATAAAKKAAAAAEGGGV